GGGRGGVRGAQPALLCGAPVAPQVAEELARRESARMVGMLVRLLGDVDRAEDVFQESLVTALEHWPQAGLPDNPAAWIATTARRRALDELRRVRLHRAKHEVIAREMPQ